MAPDKPSFWSFAKTPAGAVLIAVPVTAIIALLFAGIIKPRDLHGERIEASERALVSDKEAMKLYIEQAARQAAVEVMKQSDEKWEIRWNSLKEQVEDLKRTARWSNLRSESVATNKPSVQ